MMVRSVVAYTMTLIASLTISQSMARFTDVHSIPRYFFALVLAKVRGTVYLEHHLILQDLRASGRHLILNLPYFLLDAPEVVQLLLERVATRHAGEFFRRHDQGRERGAEAAAVDSAGRKSKHRPTFRDPGF